VVSLSQLWSSAALVEIAIALTLAEWLALVLYHRFTGNGPAPHTYGLNLVSGLCLMLALRSALQGEDWIWGAGCLAASGLAHLAYLRQRWQRQREIRRQAFLA
jgi:hypothetical protein